MVTREGGMLKLGRKVIDKSKNEENKILLRLTKFDVYMFVAQNCTQGVST